MEYTRLNSPSALAEALRDLKKRVAKVENKPMGTISFVDEVTGEETIVGTLPDGSTGVEQFIGDTTPPPVATAPYVSAQPGNFVVTWDGSFVAGAEKPRDFVHVNVIGHKMDVDGITTLVSIPVGVIRTVTESVLVTLDVAAGGESWQFSLEAEDYNGNKSAESARTASIMMIDSISSTDQAWIDMNAEIAGKGRTFTQSVAPPIEERLPQNLWIDTSLGVNLSVTKFWDATANAGAGAWVPVKDQEINAAELRAAADAKAKADAAASAAINAQAYSLNASFDDWTGTLPAFHTLYGTGNPTKETTIVQRGAYAARFNCTDTTTDRGLNWGSGLLSHAPNLEYFTVEVSFYLASGTSLNGAGVLLDWLGMTNNRATLSLAAEVPAPVTGKWYNVSKTLRRPTNATGTWTGMDGYLMANHSAGALGTSKAVKDIIFDWLNVRPATAEEILAYNAPTISYVDQAEADAISAAATDATTKANQAKTDAIADTTTKLAGKNKVVWSTSPATGTSGYVTGDTWFQRDDTGAVIAQWEFTTSWESRKVSDAVLGNLSAGKITYGVLDGGLIGANTITAKSLFIGDFTNYVVNGFGDLGAGVGWGSGLIYDTTDKPTSVTGVFKSTASQSTYATPATFFSVDPATEYTTEIWLKADKPDSRIYIEFRDQNGGLTTANYIMDTGASQGNYALSNLVVPTAWTKYTVKTVTSATTTKLRVGSIYFNHTNGTERTATVSLALSMRRRLGGSLLVDGAIDGKVITGPTIQTEATANRGIKLTDGEFAGYDTSGNKNFSLTSSGALTLKGSLQSGSTIAGATITGNLETTANASRGVKLSNTGINAWNGSGDLTFRVDAATGIVDAPGIRTNSLSGDKVIAKSLTADKLVITSTDNLLMEADFANLGKAWDMPSGLTINATAGRGSLPALRLTSTTSTVTALNMNDDSLNIKNKIAIGSDSRFRGSMWVKSTDTAVSGSYKIVGRFYTSATAFTDITIASSPVLVANTWTNVEGIVPATIPSTAIAAEFYLSLKNAATGTITDIDFASVTRASDGKLIVDGAIDGKTITGATIQTAATGPRIVLDQDALNAWNSDGDNYFNVSNETGVNISSKGKAGYDTTRTNYCTNPSMEVDISGWTSAHTLTRDSAFYVGTASLKATHTATADRIVSRKQPLGYPLNAGDYRFSAWVKHNSGVSKTVTAKFYFTDSANAPVAGGTFSGSATTVPPNVWTRVVSGTSTAGTPSNAYNVRMDIVGTAFTSTEALWIDAVYLEGGDFSTFPALNDYFDGDTPATVDKTYVWGSTTGVGLDVSYEHTDRDVRIKSGGNVVLSPMGGSKVAPGIGFIPPVPYLQTAGLFSDGQVVSLIGGADDPMLTRLDVGNQKIESYSYNSTSIVSRDFLHIGSQIGIVDISGSAGVSVNGLSIDSSDWAVVPLSGAWVSYAGGGSYYGGLRARRVGETIQIQGMVKSGAAGTMGTLPMDLAPRYTSLRLVAAGTATTPRQNAYIIIGGGTGIITYDSGPTAPTFVSINEFIPLY